MSRTIKDMPWRVRWADQRGRRLSPTWRDDYEMPRRREFESLDDWHLTYQAWRRSEREAWRSVEHGLRDHRRRHAGASWEERRMTEGMFRAMERAALAADDWDGCPTGKDWRRKGWWWD